MTSPIDPAGMVFNVGSGVISFVLASHGEVYKYGTKEIGSAL
jgi:hypothetical protein